MSKKKDPELEEKWEQIKRLKRATAPGMFPGQNRSRKFKNRKKAANKYKCRKKVDF